jgi:flagellar biosynthesis/type III secretory pathway M-ring protein FliF/YscJ
MQTGTIIVISFFIGAVAILVLIRIVSSKEKQQQLNEKTVDEPELTKRFFMGQYKSGLPGFQGPAPIVFCGVTEDFFVLRKGTQGAEIGRIPRAAVHKVNLTKQNEKNRFLTVEWSDAAGSIQRTQFQFIDKIAKQQTTDAADLLRQWMGKEAALAAA